MTTTTDYSPLAIALADALDHRYGLDEFDRAEFLEEFDESDDVQEIEICAGRYLILTDDGVEDEWTRYLERYCDDVVRPELTGIGAQYFDEESWMADRKHGDWPSDLGRFDGKSIDVRVGDEWRYAVRLS